MLVAVIGSRANSGACCVAALAKKGFTVRAVSRSGQLSLEQEGNPGIVPVVGDVTRRDTLISALSGVQAVVFAASATAGWRFPSSRTDTPPQVDYEGCKSVAEVCVELNIPQFIVISSACTTRSMFSSVPYFLLNSLFGRLMYWKRQGELATQSIIESNPLCSWTIIRPGGLTNEAALPPSSIQLLTGDLQSNRIPRANVGEIVAACVGNEDAKNVAFECVSGDSGASTYEELLRGIAQTKQ